MSMRDYEMEMVVEARKILGNKKLRLKDLMEWRTTEFKARENETYTYLPRAQVYVSFLIPATPAKEPKKG